MVVRSLLAIAMFITSSAALAGDGTQVPEGSQLTLFALGFIWVIVGRRVAMRSPED
jgi:hypothetical protein